MTAQEVIEKIKAEIEMRLKANGSFDEEGDSAWHYDQGMIEAYQSILSFIKSMEKEQPEGVDLEREINTLFYDKGWSCLEDINTDVFARHFYELGCRHTAVLYDDIEKERQRRCEQEQIEEISPKLPLMSQVLDKAAHKYAWEKQENHIDFDGEEYFDYGPRFDAFKARAKWCEAQIPKLPDSIDEAASRRNAETSHGALLGYD